VPETRRCYLGDISPKGLALIANCTALERLHLGYTKTNDKVLQALTQSNLKNQLVKLDVRDCIDISPEGRALLANFTSLKKN